MKTVLEAKNAVSKMWGVPKKTEGQTYRLMHYVLRNECEDGILLYNVVTSEMILLESGFDLDGLLPGVYSPEMDELINHHFAVPEDYDEKKSVDQLRVILRKLNKPKYITGYTIYPTTCCNARCFYCFESGFKKETMTTETADAVVKYIVEHSGGKPIEITWFGGEPLVGKHIITYICERLNENGVKFISSMVSNAYLFDKQTAKTAVDLWKVNRIQITLDGTEQVYNLTKAYQGVDGSPFRRVLDNIDTALEAGVQVAIRLNVTQENATDLTLLIDELKKRFIGKKGLQAYVHSVMDDVGYAPSVHSDESKESLYHFERLLRDKLVREQLSVGIHRYPQLKYINCMADNDGSVTIFPSGKLGKCEDSSQEDTFGDVFGNVIPAKLGRCKEYQQYEQCNTCPLYPECLHLTVCPEHGDCNSKKATDKVLDYCRFMSRQYSIRKNDKSDNGKNGCVAEEELRVTNQCI